ncbi:hypothetical protein BDB01DRAFT_775561 [Pilobolus umbonatus]|nr:hypothetical protein BDB01DRAFT_775561 [Pilobolus umbonatus]
MMFSLIIKGDQGAEYVLLKGVMFIIILICWLHSLMYILNKVNQILVNSYLFSIGIEY